MLSTVHPSISRQFSVFLEFLKRNEFGKKISYSISLFVTGTLAILFFVLALFNNYLAQDIQRLRLRASPFPDFHMSQYPLLGTHAEPPISATAAIIMDADSQVVVYQKNADFRFSPASTTKIMTALVSLDQYHPDDILTVTKTIDTEGSGLGLFTGEKLSYESLLKAALIYSANDAAYTIAENYPGGETAFVAAMNAKAQALHLANTHFGDPDGLDDTENYTTARDLVRLSALAMEKPLFASIVHTKSATIISSNSKNTYTFQNRNILLGFSGINGIKTGYTDEAGEVLATSVQQNNHTFYIIVMKSKDRFLDTQTLLPLLTKIQYISL